jgi:hypothetical protein
LLSIILKFSELQNAKTVRMVTMRDEMSESKYGGGAERKKNI